MAKTTKFTEEELNEIKELQNLYNTVVYQAGQVYLDKLTLRNKENQVNSNIEEVKKKEETIISSLTKTYGVGSINLETGEFTPIED
jgi:bifunctional pyridoxal-dependent enzyme with beta-cystathionase and maltose regulon repressor activities